MARLLDGERGAGNEGNRLTDIKEWTKLPAYGQVKRLADDREVERSNIQHVATFGYGDATLMLNGLILIQPKNIINVSLSLLTSLLIITDGFKSFLMGSYFSRLGPGQVRLKIALNRN